MGGALSAYGGLCIRRPGGGGEAAAAVATEGMSVAGLSQRVRAERIRTGPGKGWD